MTLAGPCPAPRRRSNHSIRTRAIPARTSPGARSDSRAKPGPRRPGGGVGAPSPRNRPLSVRSRAGGSYAAGVAAAGVAAGAARNASGTGRASGQAPASRQAA